MPITRNQQSNGGTWQTLGSFDFEPGKSQGVTLSDESDGVVIADALRWVGPLAGRPSGASARPPRRRRSACPAPCRASGRSERAVDRRPGRGRPARRARRHDRRPGHGCPSSRTCKSRATAATGRTSTTPALAAPRTSRASCSARAMRRPPGSPPRRRRRSAQSRWSGRTVGDARGRVLSRRRQVRVRRRVWATTSPIIVHDRCAALDGSTWYRVDQGYLAEGSVRLPKPPERTYAGRWIDADLTEPAMLVAYEGDTARPDHAGHQRPHRQRHADRRLHDRSARRGRNHGQQHPGRPDRFPRRATSWSTCCITQYFTADGASIHYNYWSSNFGYLGLARLSGCGPSVLRIPVELGVQWHSRRYPHLRRTSSTSPTSSTARGWLARVYRPRGDGPFPALLEVHGGAWTNNDRTQNADLASALAQSGMVVARSIFGWATTAPYPASLADVNCATRWLKASASSSARRLMASAGSACRAAAT